MSGVINFIKSSVEEMTSHVTWPTYKELQSSTILVLIASMLFAVMIGLIDVIFEKGLGYIYSSI